MEQDSLSGVALSVYRSIDLSIQFCRSTLSWEIIVIDNFATEPHLYYSVMYDYRIIVIPLSPSFRRLRVFTITDIHKTILTIIIAHTVHLLSSTFATNITTDTYKRILQIYVIRIQMLCIIRNVFRFHLLFGEKLL